MDNADEVPVPPELPVVRPFPRKGESTYLIKPNLLGTERIHIFAGSPYAGKSTFLAQVMKSLIDPAYNFIPELNFTKIPLESIGLIFTDRPWSDNSEWINLLGLQAIPHYCISGDKEALKYIVSESNDSYLKLFKYCVSKLPDTCRLLIVDVMTTCFLGKNIHDQKLVYRHMQELQLFCAERGITIIGTGYGSKQKQGMQDRYVRLVDRIIGAAALRGTASDLLYIASKEETQEQRGTQVFQELHWLPRQGMMLKFALRRAKENGLFAVAHDVILGDDIFVEEGAPGELDLSSNTKTAKNYLTVLELIPLEGISRRDLTKLAIQKGITQPTAYRIVKKLLLEGFVLEKEDLLYKLEQN